MLRYATSCVCFVSLRYATHKRAAPMSTLTLKTLIREVRALGLSIRVTDGEIRINYRGGKEETAYYTDDRADALGTARAMTSGKTDEIRAAVTALLNSADDTGCTDDLIVVSKRALCKIALIARMATYTVHTWQSRIDYEHHAAPAGVYTITAASPDAAGREALKQTARHEYSHKHARVYLNREFCGEVTR